MQSPKVKGGGFAAHGDIAEMLRELVLGGLQCSVELGLVMAPFVPVNPIPGAAGAAPLIQLALQPGNRPCEARVAYLGAGPLAGVLTPLLVGTEVLVMIPEDQPHHAVCLGAFHSAKNPIPPTWTGLNFRLQHPLGGELRSAEGLPADGIVLGNMLTPLAAYLDAMETVLLAISAATTPATTAAVSTFQASTAAFKAALAVSAGFVDPDSGGVGGAPFASTLWRSTT